MSEPVCSNQRFDPVRPDNLPSANVTLQQNLAAMFSTRSFLFRQLLLATVLWGCHLMDCPNLVGAEPIRFDRDIRPLLSDKCFHCHGPDSENRQADLRLDVEENAKEFAIVPGQASASEFMRRIVTDDASEIMPPRESNKTLSAEERRLLANWIDQGAGWSQHWAFMQPREIQPTTVDSEARVNAIDDFVFRTLSDQGLKPSPPADPTTLIRRLTFDLTGLPPTLEEVDRFLADKSVDAYEKAVDRLLASEHYGERMAVPWLDAARYGDTSVYHADGPRDMWAWRDAVVQAYNDNMPYDEFSIAQLAGDLLPDADLREKVLSGFNRNNGTTDEGGAIAEEYRVEYAVDRVKTTSTVWLGLTMECAQCHDHKYDPISQEEYYQFYAFFNRSRDSGMQTRNGNAQPILSIPDPAKRSKIPSARERLESAKQALAQHKSKLEPQFEPWLATQDANPLASALPRGPVLNASLSEGEGRITAEWAAHAQGRLMGKPTWVETPLDQGLNFSGNGYVDFGNIADFERSDAFSYGGWVNPSGGVGAMLARMDQSNAYRGFDLYVGASPISVHVIHDWPGNAIKVTTRKRLKKDQWYHVFATYDGSSKATGIKIYVDGEQWDWDIEQDGLTHSIRTEKSFLIGSRHPDSRFKGKIDSVQVYDYELSAENVRDLAHSDSLATLLAIDAKSRTESQLAALNEHFFASVSPDYLSLREAVSKIQSEIEELKKPLTTVMVMGDMEKPRDTFVLSRGAYDSPTDHRVEPGTLGVLPPMASDLPRNRLGLAQWLFAAENPLTARVSVNRLWQRFFGGGLVGTPGDFGAQGEFPSHPELLDWMANDFRSHGWNIKRTVKQIVMSATYRQSSHASPSTYRGDPANRLLARGSRFRLEAEFIRDMALSLGGILDQSMGGPGVKPYQPAGLWVEVGLGGKPAFVQDHGTKLYRRSLYTYWKRSAPPPTMQIFDAPTREKCTIRRPRTNTPLQALVVLNDPQFVEAARHFAQRILSTPESSDVSRLKTAFRMATSRLPSPMEIQNLMEVLQGAKRHYADHPELAGQLLTVGESDRDKALDASVHAGWTIVASTIMNLDETLTRE